MVEGAFILAGLLCIVLLASLILKPGRFPDKKKD